MGVWQSLAMHEYEPYIKPQDCENHFNIKQLKFTDDDGVLFSSEKPFEFSVLHYTVEELDEKAHAFELENSNTIEVLIC